MADSGSAAKSDDEVARRGRGPSGSWTLGGRPHHRTWQLRNRHIGRTYHPIHDVAPPAPPGRTWRLRVKNGPALAGHGAEAVRDAITSTIAAIPDQLRRSLTWDQGAEMAQHAQLRIDSGLHVFFCDPRSPWQRATNENTNGLLRQYFPKGTDLSRHSARDIAAVAATLNRRPRKTLSWRTPSEVFNELLRSHQGGRVATTG